MRLPSFTPAFVCIFVGALLLAPASFGQNLARGKGRVLENGPADVDQLTARASVIVRGIVQNRQTKWVNRVIYTDYQIQVQETVKGSAQSSLTVSVPGGKLGNVELKVPGSPQLQLGDQLILFGEASGSDSTYKPVGAFSGIVPINAGTSNSKASVAPRGKPEDLEEFLEEVRGKAR